MAAVTSTTSTVGIVPDCDLLAAGGPNEVFAFFGSLLAGQDLDVVTMGAGKAPIPVVGALSVLPQHDFADAPTLDLLFVPGGGDS